MMNGTVGLVRSYYATVGLVRSEVMRVLLASCAVALGLDCLYAVALKGLDYLCVVVLGRVLVPCVQ
jgi:hypothetical protein